MARCNKYSAEDLLSGSCGGSSRPGNEDYQYQLVTRGGGYCEEITLVKNDGRDRDTELLDCWAEGNIENNGTDLALFRFNPQKSERDPLYGEFITRAWDGPYRLYGWAKKPDKTVREGEDGSQAEFAGTIEVARSAIEALNIGRPKEGDILLYWDLPFYQNFGSFLSEDILRAGWYFHVNKVDTEGHFRDGPHFSKFVLEVFRRTSFTPEREIYADTERTR